MKRKYKVVGHTTVKVFVEVFAEDDEEAIEIAREQTPFLYDHFDKSGTVKSVGVYGDGESVEADERIVYDDVDFAEEDSDEED